MPELPSGLAFTSDGRWLIAASAGGMIASWDTRTGQPGETRRIGEAGSTTAIALDRQGALVAVRKMNGEIEVHDLASRNRIGTISTGSGTISGLVFDHASRRVAVVFPSTQVAVWDVLKPNRPAVIPGAFAMAVFGPRGEVVCPLSRGKGLSIWSPDGGSLRTMELPHGDPPLALTFSTDGTRLACSHGGPGVDILDWTTRRLAGSLKGRIKRVRHMDFSTDGKVLATAEDDGIVRLWNAASGDELLTLRAEPGAVRQLRFAPDDRALAAGVQLPDGHAEVLVWHAVSDDGR
jgi:WD40 repeat protein